MKLAPHKPIKYGFHPENPPKVPLEHAENGHFLPSFDERLWLFYRQWEPPQSTPIHATLMILHGTVDHSGVYDELATTLIQNGIAVVAMDMRGWGLSDGESMYFHDIDTFVADVEHLYKVLHSLPRYKQVMSRFLLGKSLGGTISAYCVARRPTYWTGLLGLSGAYNCTSRASSIPSPLAIHILKGLSLVMPKIPLKKLFDEHYIVSDAEALQAWRDDPLCSKDKVRIGYVVTILGCLEEIPNTIVQQINIPMLIMWGKDDCVVDISGHEVMVDKSRHTDTVLKCYEGGRHNLLQEPSLKQEVIKDIQEWILAHASDGS